MLWNWAASLPQEERPIAYLTMRHPFPNLTTSSQVDQDREDPMPDPSTLRDHLEDLMLTNMRIQNELYRWERTAKILAFHIAHTSSDFPEEQILADAYQEAANG